LAKVEQMIWFLAALLILFVACFAGFVLGFLHFHRTITRNQLHGKKTWAEELEYFAERGEL
jgi:hypothetical protein